MNKLPGRIGAYRTHSRVEFTLWAPLAKKVEIKFYSGKKKSHPMNSIGNGYFYTDIHREEDEPLYKFKLDGKKEFPDPASRLQPDGVHGPSAVVDSGYPWVQKHWSPVPWDQMVFYEIHIGTFTKAGTFEAAAKKLSALAKLGVTAIEILPVAQFPGKKNWGYDGAYPFAVQESYGGPIAFKKFIDKCHGFGLSVYLDVVYNHLGPEGNYLSQFGPYFQSRYKTPWGPALNFDGPDSGPVRQYFLQNAEQWLKEFNLDGLRLDAVHAICDLSATPFLEDLCRLKQIIETQTRKSKMLVAESDDNDSRLLKPLEEDGIGMDAQWADDFHHALHARLSEERLGYYQDFGTLDQIEQVIAKGVLFEGNYSEFRKKRHGRSYRKVPKNKLVVCVQNHDQVGNRFHGDRLTTLVSDEKTRLAATCLFLSPFTPLLFMGEEQEVKNPFLYFIDHSDKNLVEAVRQGRKKEFSGFAWKGAIPDPADDSTFQNCVLDEMGNENSAAFLYYRELIRLSKWIRKNGVFEPLKAKVTTSIKGRILNIHGQKKNLVVQLWHSFSKKVERIPYKRRSCQILFNSQDWFQQSEPKTVLVSGNITLQPYTSLLLKVVHE